MSMELIAIISVGVALAGVILNGQRNQREEIKALREEMQAEFKLLREEINSLRERVAHLEGLLEGLREAITGRRVAITEAVAEDAGHYDKD